MNDSPDALRAEAVRLHRTGDAGAARAYAQYLARRPGDAAIWSNLGALHRKAGRHDLALYAHRRAEALAPQDAGVLTNLANVLSDIGDYDASLHLRSKLLAARPDDAAQEAMVVRCHRGKGDYETAIFAAADALERHPGDPELTMQLAFAQLGAGDYAAGFASYRARWAVGELRPRKMPMPEWDGGPLEGKTILVLPEQGFGDAILFARFLPVLTGRGARVLLACKPPLRRLFERLAGVDALVAEDETAAQAADVWVNMMDLAALHFAQGSAVPPPARLDAPRDASGRAAAITAPHRQAFRVGVVWTGSVTYRGNAFRSFSHRDLLPLADLPRVQLFSLYKGPELDAFHTDGADTAVIDAGSSERDFADCAAMMQAMDLVITSDTATAHLAGSLGLPAWVLLHWDPFWVWKHSGNRTEWYPNIHLYRQDAPRDWSPVMARVRSDLASRVAGLERCA